MKWNTRKLALSGLALFSFAFSTSHLFAAEKAVLTARAQATTQVGFDVYLPLQHRDQLEQLLSQMHNASSSQYHKWLTPQEFHARFDMDDSSVSVIKQQLSNLGLTVTQPSSHRLHITGDAGTVERALGTTLKTGKFASGKQVVAATGSLTTPSALTQANAVVSGLSSMVRMRTHSFRSAKNTPDNRYGPTGAYWFTDLKQAYSFPSYKAYTGKGATIGILMAGDYNPPDMDLYFGHEKLATPKISTVNINGGAPPLTADAFETHLDIQQSGGMAPGASIILYNVPNLSDDNLLAALDQILSDNKADVVSMSFGAPEIFYTAAFNDGVDFTDNLRAYDDLFAQGNAQGITFVASTGDSGGLSAVPLACFDPTATSCGSAIASAQSPSTSPHVTAVGGTNLITTSTGSTTDLNSAYVRESAYADPLAFDIFFGTVATGSVWGSGGGDSILYKKPIYQYLVNTGNNTYRTTPDVSLHMGGCPNGVVSCSSDDSADAEAYDGQLVGVIGTSASAPDFAGLTALAVQRYGQRMGNENYYLYTLAGAQFLGLPLNVFHTGIPGDNGAFHTTTKGYNRVLGNGTLNGVNYLLSPFTPAAGIPQTPSNP